MGTSRLIEKRWLSVLYLNGFLTTNAKFSADCEK